jgi:orotidine-5'-phosphate decarboxylase
MPEPLVKGKKWLQQRIIEQRSILTVGLDTDINLLPAFLHQDAFAFNKAIIEATLDVCVAYKLNFAFYESLGMKGWEILEKTIRIIPPTHLIIADAKRGDIGNTSRMYARAVYDHLGCDAITVSPYMGADSVIPFFREGKWVIILALTSNAGNRDFQTQKMENGDSLFECVMNTSTQWGSADNTMFVVGATHPDDLRKIRNRYPDHFFLVPGIGVQGGDIEAICKAGLSKNGGLLLNASRSIIYAGDQEDFAMQARAEAVRINEQVLPYLISTS